MGHSKIIPYGKQEISASDIECVAKVLSAEFLTQGPLVAKFESRISKFCGANYSIAVNSATSALHIACLALEVGPGDIVWTSAITFAASANCVLNCGAKIDFVDIDSKTFNMSVECLEEKLAVASKANALPKVVIPVHMAGQSCEMEKIYNLSLRYGFRIIEDASHAIGARYKNKYVGCCAYSDIAVFSFHPVKIITTGEGGMALTNDLALAQKMMLRRSHGITSDPIAMIESPKDEIWNYQQVELGFNYRLTDIQAALGISQLEKIEDFVCSRHQIAEKYQKLLEGLPIKLPFQIQDSYSSFHLYIIRLELEAINKTQKEVFLGMREAGILVNLHYIPVYRHPYFARMEFHKGYCPNAEVYFKEAISIPMFPSLSVDDQRYVVDRLQGILLK